MDVDALRASLPLYASGARTTLVLLLLSLSIGLVGAVPLAILRSSSSRWVSRTVWCFTYALRGTPMLVQIYLIYYGLGQFEAIRESFLWPSLRSAWFCTVLAFAGNTCAYTTEILHGAMNALPFGEIEAAKAMGMSRLTTLRAIVLPGALRRSLPAYGNEVVLMLHGTALASTVTLFDLTGAAREVYSRYYLPFEAFIAAGVVYLAFTTVLVALFHLAERRWLLPLQPRS